MEGIAQLTAPRTVTSVDESLEQAHRALTSLRVDASAGARLFGFTEAADFAGRVEEVSRAVEFLQIVAAQAMERTRQEAPQSRPPSAPGWRTGWTEASAVSGAPAPPPCCASGGLRPQVTVTIGYRDLFQQLKEAESHSPRTSSGSATFQGPVHPRIIRKIACDADIIPVLLGSNSRVLDVGRTTRIFPPHIRKAIAARDQGCAFPDCTMPVPWCEAHHISYWSRGGATSTENGTLLCSHHHHVIHKEQWKITVKAGVPWFIPPPHLDPRQTPRRNHHHHPLRT